MHSSARWLYVIVWMTVYFSSLWLFVIYFLTTATFFQVLHSSLTPVFLTWQSLENPTTPVLLIQHNTFLFIVYGTVAHPFQVGLHTVHASCLYSCFKRGTGQTWPAETILALSPWHRQFFTSGFHLTVNFSFQYSPRGFFQNPRVT